MLLTKKKLPIIYAGYRFGQALDPHVAFSTAGRGAIGHEYWVQLFNNGCTGFLQSAPLAV
jgi:hypothetical protein